jgi:acetolactate synthase I/III small subunit
MSTLVLEPPVPASTAASHAVLELTVHNHPGVMSHICGLFARRAFNVDGILCMPVNGGRTSRIWLRVREDRRLEQLVRQMEKLADVLDVRRHDAEHEVFLRLERFFTSD